MTLGLIHIYCGDGKGKTTAATGLAVRHAGCGGKVLLARFLKNNHSGELEILKRISEIEIMNPLKAFHFYSTLSEEEKAEMKDVYITFWQTITQAITGGHYTMLVMDEFMAAYNYGIIDRQDALNFLKNKPESLEVVLTGREPADELVALASYVSEIRKIKHPFDQGTNARKGIEF